MDFLAALLPVAALPVVALLVVALPVVVLPVVALPVVVLPVVACLAGEFRRVVDELRFAGVVLAVVFFAAVFFAALDVLRFAEVESRVPPVLSLAAVFLAVVLFAAAVPLVVLFLVAVLFLVVFAVLFLVADLLALDVFFAPAADTLVDLLTVSFGGFFAPDTTAFRSAPARNFGTAVFFARMRSPVAGLRTIRAGRTIFSKAPNPVIATFSPFATSRVMVCTTESSA